MLGGVGAGQHGHHSVTVFDDHRLIAALLHHILDQPPLYGVVVGDQNTGGHGFPRNATLCVSNRGTLADAD
jgi:hypothetical protein